MGKRSKKINKLELKDVISIGEIPDGFFVADDKVVRIHRVNFEKLILSRKDVDCLLNLSPEILKGEIRQKLKAELLKILWQNNHNKFKVDLYDCYNSTIKINLLYLIKKMVYFNEEHLIADEKLLDKILIFIFANHVQESWYNEQAFWKYNYKSLECDFEWDSHHRRFQLPVLKMLLSYDKGFKKYFKDILVEETPLDFAEFCKETDCKFAVDDDFWPEIKLESVLSDDNLSFNFSYLLEEIDEVIKAVRGGLTKEQLFLNSAFNNIIFELDGYDLNYRINDDCININFMEYLELPKKQKQSIIFKFLAIELTEHNPETRKKEYVKHVIKIFNKHKKIDITDDIFYEILINNLENNKNIIKKIKRYHSKIIVFHVKGRSEIIENFANTGKTLICYPE